jgi:hypothetical protein
MAVVKFIHIPSGRHSTAYRGEEELYDFMKSYILPAYQESKNWNNCCEMFMRLIDVLATKKIIDSTDLQNILGECSKVHDLELL